MRVLVSAIAMLSVSSIARLARAYSCSGTWSSAVMRLYGKRDESTRVAREGDKSERKPYMRRRIRPDTYSREDLLECVRTRDFDLARSIYAKLKQDNVTSTEVMCALIGVCEKKEHLEVAFTFFNEIQSAGMNPTEQAYLALIRCYTDGGRTTEAISLIQSMLSLGIAVKHRIFQPILDRLVVDGDMDTILNLLSKMLSLGIYPRSEQIQVLLMCCLKVDMRKYADAVNALLLECSKDLIGLEYRAVLSIAAAFTHNDRVAVEDEGILVDSAESIPGRIVARTDSFAISQNVSFDIRASLESVEDTHLASPPPAESPSNATSSDSGNTSAGGDVSAEVTGIVEDRYIVRDASTHSRRRARVVNVASTSCLCPNCGAHVRAMALSEDAKSEARAALKRVVSSSSAASCKNLEAFASWLEDKEEFTYVVDGANVAYNRQNFGDGKFSFRQIEVIVDELKSTTNKRVLVLLPQKYVQKVVPNMAKNKLEGGRHFSVITEEDQSILSRFREEDMLYVVPNRSDDDWYWLFATVAANRTTYAITNDLTRDHRLAFLESRMYVRWRNNHIVHFDFDKAIDGNETTLAKLTFPELFSREIQLEADHWHFPATDRQAWLCVDVSAASQDVKDV